LQALRPPPFSSLAVDSRRFLKASTDGTSTTTCSRLLTISELKLKKFLFLTAGRYTPVRESLYLRITSPNIYRFFTILSLSDSGVNLRYWKISPHLKSVAYYLVKPSRSKIDLITKCNAWLEN